MDITSTRDPKKPKLKRLSSILLLLGFVISGLAIVLFSFIYYPVISAEIAYFFSNHGSNSIVVSKTDKTSSDQNAITPVDEDFGIVIPKINANSKVIKDVNPYNSQEYQRALTKGVAHAKGSAYPGQFGNVFMFSHSSVDFYQASRYNSIFYLLSKLERGDDIYIFYNKVKIKYSVTEKKIVEANNISYLSNNSKDHTLTLMTCWPAGTSLKRLIVVAQVAE